MAEGPSYTTVPGRIPALLGKVRDTAVPPKATIDWLRQVGFTSSNDRTLISVLRQIGFVDTTGVPQPAWREYRGAGYRSVLGRAIVLGYSSLYDTYPDAHNRSSTELAHILNTKTDAGKQAVDKMVNTFKNLAKEADFSATPAEPGSGESSNGSGQPEGSSNGSEIGSEASVVTRTVTANGMTINVNVQLTLPETSDEKVFEAFFKSMRKYLIDDNAP